MVKGRLWRKTIAACLALLLVTGNVPIQPVADLFGNMAITANAETTTSTINVSGTDYTLFTGFTATDGNGTNYAKLVDGNTSTDWSATKNFGEVTNHFNGGTADPAFVEFHADEPIVPKGYVLTCDHENAGFWKPVEWALKAKLNEGDEWTTIQSSTTTLGAGKTFEIACDNDGDNQYQYFRFEVYEVGLTHTVDLDELQIYGSLPAYTHLTVKAATCMATGIKQECYRRNSDGKYFTDETGATELAESDVIAPIAAHTGVHHEATDTHIEYWQCPMCSKYFSNEDCTTEITEEDTKIYRTITIDNSISGLVTVGFGKTKALAGETVYLYISDLIDASTLKVNDGAVKLTAVTDIQYTFTMPAADVTVTADVAQSNVDSDILTGSIRHTVTIADGANITLNNATISGSIICEGSATITLVGTNSVSGADKKAGIQIGGSGTTLTIRGDGSLTANGGSQSAGIGLSRIWNYDSNVSSGDIVIEGGTITTTGGNWGAGIGTGVVKNTNNNNSTSVQFGNITIKGGSVTAIGGDSGDGIGKGYAYSGPTITIGTVTIYDGIDKVDASSIKDFANVVYMHGNDDVTANKTDYFTIGEDSNRRLIVQKPVIAEIAEQAYTGSAVTPEPQVTIGSLNLTKGTDYVYSYTNNTNFGTATVRATFQGDYASLGYVEKEFTILPPPVVVNVTGNGTVTYNDKSAASGETIGVTAEKGTDVTLTLTPENGYAVRSVEYGYTNSNEMTMNGAKLPINGSAATLTVPNDLKDGTYVNLTVTFVSALAGGADEASAVALTDNTVTDLAGGWYKVDSDITFDHTLNLLGDTHLIIDDGKTMTVSTATGKGIDSDYTLNVGGAGALSVTASGSNKIAIRVGNYVQTGATVTASGFIGIRCCDDFDEFNVTNDFTFSGGQLTATGSGGNGIWADNDITLSCTNATDFILASSYSSAHGAVKVADGKMFKNGSDEYSGTLSDNDIQGKKLSPVTKTLTLPTSIANGTLTADQSGDVLVGDTVTLTVTPDAGYTLKSLTVMNGETAVAVENNQFTMPAGDVTVSAEFAEIITYTEVPAKAATCTEDGNIKYYTGSDGKLYVDENGTLLTDINGDGTVDIKDTVVTKLGHDWNAPTYSWTATAGGYKCTATRTCKNGSHPETEEVTATYTVVTPPTAGAKGLGRYTATFTNGAFEVQTKDVEIDMVAPEYDAPTYTWAADNSSVTAERKCLNGGADLTETVNTTSEVTKSATCKAMGETTYYAVFTNDLFASQEKTVANIATTDHSYTESSPIWSWVKNGDSYDVSVQFKCSICGDIEECDEEPELTFVDEDGYRTYTASVEFEDETYTMSQRVKLSYNVTVNGVTTQYAYDEVAEAKVTTIDEGKFFDGWYEGDKKVSSLMTYTFTVRNDVTLEARFVESAVQAEPILNFSVSEREVLANGKNKVSFTVEWELPDDCALVQAAIIRSYTNTDPKYNSSDATVKVSTLRDLSGSYKYNLTLGTASASKTIYARGYIIYLDKNGTSHQMYTDVIVSNSIS